MLTRTMTESEWSAVKAALPKTNAFKFINEIDRVKECCWNCDFYDGCEGKPGKCNQFDMEIPNDQRSQTQECFIQMIVPF